MTKPAIISPDPLVNKVHKLLKSVEPRPLPTETMVSEYGHKGWKCPICGEYCRRDDRTTYHRGRQETNIDYSSYNMHFAHNHGTPFWKEQKLIDLIKKELEG